MLFRRKNCTQCGSSYDVVRETCPACHTRDEHYEELGIPKNIIWLPIYKQLIVFFVGWLGLQIVGEVFALIISNFISDQAFYLMIVNLVRYLIIAIALACILIGNYKDFKKGFTRWWAYLVGIRTPIPSSAKYRPGSTVITLPSSNGLSRLEVSWVSKPKWWETLW